MPNDFTSVDIWVGAFSQADMFEAYVRERPEHFADETDTVPISDFAADVNAWFIDHDFQCNLMLEQATSDIRELLQESLLHADFGEPNGRFGEAHLNERYARECGKPANAIILVYGDEIQHPQSVQGDGYWLHYLGRFYEHQT